MPIAMTVWVIKLIGYDLLDQPARKLVAWIVRLFVQDTLLRLPEGDTYVGPAATIEHKAIGLGVVITLAAICAVGAATRSFLGRQLLRLFEVILARLPLIRSVYSGIKQISDAVFGSAGKAGFSRAVLVRVLGPDSYAIGFVTGETQGEAQEVTPEKVLNVFVPTTPNPTSGFLLMIPGEKTIPLRMSVEEALKMVISGGMVTPPAANGSAAAVNDAKKSQ